MDDPYLSFIEWFSKLQQKEEQDIVEKACMVAWIIWKEMNRFVFEEKLHHACSALHHAMDMLFLFQSF